MTKIDEIFYLWVALNIVALLLLTGRSDWQKIKRDFLLFKKGFWLITLGFFMGLFLILPFSIPYSIRNIAETIDD
jgi:hypothetical protein